TRLPLSPTLFPYTTLFRSWRKRYVIATAAYALALFSKESGIIILALIALLELKQRQRKPYYAYALLLIPTGLFAAIFFTTLSARSEEHTSELQSVAISYAV